MTKVTKKDNFKAIKALVADNADLVAFCDNEIALLDAKAQKAKEAAAKKREEGDALTALVFDALSADFEPIADIAARVNDPDATVAKVTYRLTQLVKAGKAEKADIVIEGEEKSRKVKGYKAL